MQVVITRYHAATDKRGPRYSAVSSSGNDRITIKENPEWCDSSTGHFAALRALLKKIGRNWPDEIMIAGTLNQQGHQVWVTLDDQRQPRSDTPPEPCGEYFSRASDAEREAKPGDYILFREYQNGHASYVVATAREREHFKPGQWRTWGRKS